MNLNPYLMFEGRAAEAIDFYKSAIDAEVLMSIPFRDAPEPPPGGMPDEILDKVMHAAIKVGSSTVMITDGYCKGQPKFEGFSITLNTTTEAETDRYFNALADGGNVTMPLQKTFWSPRFGMLTDRFGVGWMVGILAE